QISWNVAEWRHVWHHDVSRTGIREATSQRRRASRGRSDVCRAIIIAQIIPTAPDEIERVRVNHVGGEIIIHLLAHVVDRDGHVAERSGNGYLIVRAVIC